MYEGRARHDWDQTAQLLCQQANIHGRRRRHLREFHPYYRRAKATAKVPISVLKDVFLTGKLPDDFG